MNICYNMCYWIMWNGIPTVFDELYGLYIVVVYSGLHDSEYDQAKYGAVVQVAHRARTYNSGVWQ